MISKLIDNDASLINLLKCERNIIKSLVEQNTMLQLRLQSLETDGSENAQFVQKRAGLQSQAASPVNDSIMHMQATLLTKENLIQLALLPRKASPLIAVVLLTKKNLLLNAPNKALEINGKKSELGSIINFIINFRNPGRRKWRNPRKDSLANPLQTASNKIQSNSSIKYNTQRSTVTGEAATTATEVYRCKGSKRNRRKIQQRSIKAT